MTVPYRRRACPSPVVSSGRAISCERDGTTDREGAHPREGVPERARQNAPVQLPSAWSKCRSKPAVGDGVGIASRRRLPCDEVLNVGVVTVALAGYLGDVAPYLPIANALVGRGHQGRFLAPSGCQRMLADERFSGATYPLDLSPSRMRVVPKRSMTVHDLHR